MPTLRPTQFAILAPLAATLAALPVAGEDWSRSIDSATKHPFSLSAGALGDYRGTATVTFNDGRLHVTHHADGMLGYWEGRPTASGVPVDDVRFALGEKALKTEHLRAGTSAAVAKAGRSEIRITVAWSFLDDEGRAYTLREEVRVSLTGDEEHTGPETEEELVVVSIEPAEMCHDLPEKRLVIQGRGFGAQGKVEVGSLKVVILDWSDTRIAVSLGGDRTGEHPVAVTSGKKSGRAPRPLVIRKLLEITSDPKATEDGLVVATGDTLRFTAAYEPAGDRSSLWRILAQKDVRAEREERSIEFTPDSAGEYRAEARCHPGAEPRTLRFRVEERPEVSIVDATDFVVPGSNRNCVRYSWSPHEKFRPRRGSLVFKDRAGTVVGSETSIPLAYASGKAFAEFRWDGFASKPARAPLPPEGSPYSVTVTLEGAGSLRGEATAGGIEVRRWAFLVRVPGNVPPSNPADPATRIGLAPADFTPANLVAEIQADGAAATAPSRYEARYENPASRDQQAIEAAFMAGPGAAEFLYVYTTPTRPADLAISYRVRLVPRGLRDEAGEPWDLGPAPGRENSIEWRFKTSPDGAFLPAPPRETLR